MSDLSGPDPFKEGLTLFKSGKYQESSELFLQIVSDNDQNHKAWNALGVSLSKAGDRDNAKICFDNALALDPDNSTYKKNLDRLVQSKVKQLQKSATPSKNEQKSAPKKDASRPITDYLLAGGGIIFVFIVLLVALSLIVGSHAPSQPVQPVVSSTAIPTPRPTTLPPTIATPTPSLSPTVIPIATTIPATQSTPASTLIQVTPRTSIEPVLTARPGTLPMSTVNSLSVEPSSAVCDCSGNVYNCGDFPVNGGVSAQKCYDYCRSLGKGDVHGLDKDKDSRACE